MRKMRIIQRYGVSSMGLKIAEIAFWQEKFCHWKKNMNNKTLLDLLAKVIFPFLE